MYILGCSVFICNFHRQQAWECWLTKKIHGHSENKSNIIPMFRRIAHSEAIEDSERAIEELKSSKYWESDRVLREYFTKTWLKVKEVILTAKKCKCKTIFQGGNQMCYQCYQII